MLWIVSLYEFHANFRITSILLHCQLLEVFYFAVNLKSFFGVQTGNKFSLTISSHSSHLLYVKETSKFMWASPNTKTDTIFCKCQWDNTVEKSLSSIQNRLTWIYLAKIFDPIFFKRFEYQTLFKIPTYEKKILLIEFVKVFQGERPD